ncbi:hypothetical protein ACHAWF_003058 [Thalassiosira exigua]
MTKSSSLPPRLSPKDVADLLERADEEASAAREELDHAETIAQAAGLTVRSSVLDAAYAGGSGGSAFAASSLSPSSVHPLHLGADPSLDPAAPGVDLRREASLAVRARQDYNPLRGTLSAFPLVLSTSGGHSNTDHVIRTNPDGTVDKFSEYKRRMRRKAILTSGEERGSDRWDLPRIPGGRRRRLRRDADAPSAPPEVPGTGYIMYVSQMTTKLRHDNPNRRHDQIAAVRRISSMWKVLPEAEREHYVRLARDARREYDDRLVEYRATGSWSPFTCIDRLGRNKDGTTFSNERNVGGNGPWVRMPPGERNALERELATYDRVLFPMRPPAAEEEHQKKKKESLERRKRKIREDRLRYLS